jgi:hypothetical protein
MSPLSGTYKKWLPDIPAAIFYSLCILLYTILLDISVCEDTDRGSGTRGLYPTGHFGCRVVLLYTKLPEPSAKKYARYLVLFIAPLRER